MKRFIVILALACGAALFGANPAAADPVLGINDTGAVKLGTAAVACDATMKGSIRYTDAATDTFDLCDGAVWTTIGLGGGYTIGDLLYANAATTLGKLNAGTSGYVLTSAGPGVAPYWAAGAGGGDNMGNHTATMNVKMSGFWLSNDGGNEGVYVDAAGNVGIGTAAPQTTLDVRGTLSTSISNTQVVGKLYNSASDGYLELFTGDATPTSRIKLSAFNDSYFAASGTGRVGIGTASPQAKLDVGTAGGDIYLGYNYTGTNKLYKAFTTGHAAGNVPSALQVGIGDGSWAGISINDVRDGSFNSQSIAFDTHHGGISSGTRMTIDKDGNVGIGTTGPAGVLHVVTPNNTDTNQPRFLSGGAAGTWNEIMLGSAYGAPWYNMAILRYYNGAGTAANSRLEIFNAGDSGGNGGITIVGGGNVGIRTASPGGILDIATPNGSSGGNRTVTIRDSTQTAINFGAYPGSWTAALSIQNSDNTRFLWLNPMNADSGDEARFIVGGTGLDFYVNGASASAGTLAMTLASSGAVTIPSTANPGLTVGNGSTAGFLKVGGATWYDDGSYFSLAGGRPFYLRRAEVPTTYIYSSNIYLGDGGSGTNVYFRDATLSGTSWSLTAAGAFSGSVPWGNVTGKPIGLANMPDTGQASSSAWSLAWKNYANHMVVDMSASTAPNGTGHSNTNAEIAWTGTYPTLMGWNGSNTYGVRVDSARIADDASALGGVGAGNYTRKDTWGQWLRPYYEYGNNYLTTEAPATLASQMGGAGLRVDFMHPSYTANGQWGQTITWSGYNWYGMYQLAGGYGGATPSLAFRNEVNAGTNTWTGWRTIATLNDPQTFTATQTLASGAFLWLGGGSTYGLYYNSGSFDTVGTGTSGDPLEINYYNAGDMRMYNGDITMQYGRVLYPGRVDGSNGDFQKDWYLASHSSYGLYTNTGMDFEGGVYLQGYRMLGPNTTYGTVNLYTAKNGYYGVLFGPGGTSYPNIMYDGSGNGGIYYENWGWATYYLTGTRHMQINTSGDLGYALGVSGGIRATGNSYFDGSITVNSCSGCGGGVAAEAVTATCTVINSSGFGCTATATCPGSKKIINGDTGSTTATGMGCHTNPLTCTQRCPVGVASCSRSEPPNTSDDVEVGVYIVCGNP